MSVITPVKIKYQQSCIVQILVTFSKPNGKDALYDHFHCKKVPPIMMSQSVPPPPPGRDFAHFNNHKITSGLGFQPIFER